jgi:ectoine hydroxylase-related dioxygenase (phytanoyl-CoA dioxygenase family)
MNIQEIYEFDLNGYIVYRNILSQSEVSLINMIIDTCKPSISRGTGKFSFFTLDPCFIEVMSHPRTLEIIRVMLGDQFRFDHALGIEMTKTGGAAQPLHAGPRGEHGAFFYQWVHGRMYNGLIKVIYALSNNNYGDGGFVCIPGSHKGNIKYLPEKEKISHLIVNPLLKAGDMLIFTEALVHASQQWTAEHTRRVLIYSYAPGSLAWRNYEAIKYYQKLATNELQRQLLRPPYVGDYYDEIISEKLVENRNVIRQPVLFNFTSIKDKTIGIILEKLVKKSN